jgi:hypothetical protein
LTHIRSLRIFDYATVIETSAYLASADYEEVTEDERAAIVAYIARRPTRGDLMRETGGARTVRFAGKGKGKSGGYRVITYFAAADVPVFLLDIYSKGTKANLSKAQRNTLRRILSTLAAEWRASVMRKVRQLRGSR